MEKSSAILLRECKAAIGLIAGPREWNDTREMWLHRAAKRSGLSDRTIKSLFYGEIIQADHPAVLALKKAAAEHEKGLAGKVDDLARALEGLRYITRDTAGEPCLPLTRPR